MQPLVSIVTPSFNSEAFISETLDAIAAQDYSNWEHIIIDDASTDNTLAIIEKRAVLDNRIKVIKLAKNAGSAVARNLGIKEAKGKYLTFIDSDDIWFPKYISNSINHLKTSKVPFVFSSYKRSNEKLEFVYSDFIVPTKVSYTDILKTNSISCLTAFIDIGLLGKKTMPLVRKRQDMGLWLRYLKDIPYASGMKAPQAIYRIRKDSLSRNKKNLIASQWYFYRHVENLSILKSSYYMLCWMYYGYVKYRN